MTDSRSGAPTPKITRAAPGAGVRARVLEWLLAAVLDPVDRDSLLGDLHEESGLRRSAGVSRVAVARWYRRQLLRSFWPALARRAVDPPSPRRRLPHRHGDRPMTRLLLDLRFAVRMLVRHPGFATAVLLTLALGIGSITAVFGVAHGILFQPLPYDEPDRLLLAWQQRANGPTFWFSAPNARDVAERVTTLSDVAIFTPDGFVATGGAEAVRVGGAEVSTNLPAVLGLEPVVGRAFAANEAAAPVAMVSHGFWRDQLGGDPAAMGHALQLDGRAYEVIGVLPPDAMLPLTAEIWVPIDTETQSWRQRRGIGWLQLVGRIAPGVDRTAVDAELASIAGVMAAEYPDDQANVTFVTESLADELLGDTRAPLTALLAAVALVLTAVCANVAGLLLAWSQGRGREIAVRVALGGGRGRIVSQFLVESLLLAGLGGGLGVAVAALLQRALVALAPPDTPRLALVSLDGTALMFCLGVTLISGLAFGLAPAVRAARLEAAGGADLAARSPASGTRGRMFLVAAQVAFAVVLVAGAVLLLRSFQELRSVDPGYDLDGILTIGLPLVERGFEDDGSRLGYLERVRERVTVLPGVERAGLVNALPLRDRGPTFSFGMHSTPAGFESDQLLAGYRVVSAEYFETLGIDLVEGRGFRPEEHDAAGAPVVIVDEAFVSTFLNGGPATGVEIELLGDWRPIVGVVRGIRDRTLQAEPAPRMYVPMEQAPRQTMVLTIRTGGDPAAMLPTARLAIRELDPEQALTFPLTMQDWAGRAVAQLRFVALVLACFGVAGLLLAGIGIYGVLAYSVGLRRQEIGIRMAVGAAAGSVRGQVVGQAMRITAIGLAVGVVGSLAIGRFIETLLFGVAGRDPATLAAVTVLLGLVALAAAWLPATRASRVDPVQVLRES